ncbi:Alpha/beta hydrolase family protein [Nonomuraea coxensis DSM 45129]|uniref:Alpha/beta hydrolase family protein n=1 Tax=Nonomuraea coxensis DSM 45129 TaxID=1122611 RepID=A0ABX8U5Q6_9ACTN|nr:alpha/beta hydrolase [Nonomuraea coxensis]QYC41967.1 Alpha/beta hydrolase family protein [Nonomuraea coxensis DSM 45129]
MITTVSADGTGVRAYDDGQGPPILMVHPGLSDGTRCRRLAAILSGGGYRVLRLERRQYRLDLRPGPPVGIEQEVEDVLALVRAVGAPVVLYGHSSGGVVALEALVASPSSFAGAVIFEPPVVTGPPLGGEVLKQARAAMAAGRTGKALTIFLRDTVGLPGRQAWLGGDRSPAHLAGRLDALAGVMPRAERVTLPGLDHGADLRKPGEVARVIRQLAEQVLGPA